jgi:hypothetical protein
MSVSEKTRKIVWVEAGGRCAICRVQVITPGTESDDPSVFGEEAHIVAKSPGGPRSGGLDAASLDKHTNMILLCSKHHKQIDDQPGHFTVGRLHEIKDRHGAWVRSLGEAASGRITLIPDPAFAQPRLLKLILRGNPLWNMIKETVSFEYAMPEGLPQETEDYIVEFLDLLQGYCDIAAEIDSVRQARDAQKDIETHINGLAERGCIVGAYLRRMLLCDAAGATPWPMLRVEVQPFSEAGLRDGDGKHVTSDRPGEDQPTHESRSGRKGP